MPIKEQVFPYEIDGNIVIVCPRGDSLGVEESQLKREINALHELLEQPEHQHFVVDLGSAKYYSSVVIGAFIAICTKAERDGGAAALCNAPGSVYDTLEIMRLHEIFPYYDTREEAIAAIRAPADQSQTA